MSDERGSAMKIACLGNMNNNLFSLTRYLRDEGFDAQLLLFDGELPHFHPSADSYDLSFSDYTVQLTWGSDFTFLATERRRIRRDLEPFDFIIACGTGPAFVHRAGRRLDVFAYYGSDLYLTPFFRFRLLGNPRYQLTDFLLSRAQRSGISRASYVHSSSAIAPDIIRRIGCSGRILPMPVPMIYTPLYDPETIMGHAAASRWSGEFDAIRRSSGLVLFHHARHYWRQTADRHSLKGNDRLVRGFATFASANSEARPCLVMLEYGPDVEETKGLVRHLGIEDRVRWFPPMTRKEIMLGLAAADIGCGEFEGGWFLSGTVCEALAMGKPLLHYYDPAGHPHSFGESYPLMNGRTAAEIARLLGDFMERPDHHRAAGKLGREWLLRHVVRKPVEEYVRILREASSNLDGSP